MKRLDIQSLGKRFNGLWAVADLTLALDPGEIFVLLGPNGAGKTTTLKLIAGLLKPNTGRVAIEGVDVNAEPIRAKSFLGYVPDEPFLYNKLTGREFINFVAGIYGIAPAEAAARTRRLCERFEIGTWIDQLSESYSHGMKQKIIMAQLLLHEPRLLLIDEPLVGLDPKTSKTVRETFLELRDAGATILGSTHTLSFAQEIASRIGILSGGRLRFVGKLEDLARASGSDNIEEIYLRLSDGATTPERAR